MLCDCRTAFHGRPRSPKLDLQMRHEDVGDCKDDSNRTFIMTQQGMTSCIDNPIDINARICRVQNIYSACR